MQDWCRYWVPERGGGLHAARAPGHEDPEAALEALAGDSDLEPFTRDEVKVAFARLQGPARGSDHWKAQEFRSLPDHAFDGLAVGLGLVEQEGRCPAKHQYIIEHLKPRGRGDQPLDQRPIGVLAKLYRGWAALRMDAVRRWHRGRKDQGNDWSWGSAKAPELKTRPGPRLSARRWLSGTAGTMRSCLWIAPGATRWCRSRTSQERPGGSVSPAGSPRWPSGSTGGRAS